MNANLEAAVLLRVVVGHVAEAMVDGDYETRKWAWSIAEELKRGGVDIAAEAHARIRDLGGDTWTWAAPAPEAPSNREESLRYELAHHIAGAYVSGSDDQVARAKELETALDGAGLNVDTKVDSLVLEAMRTPPSLRGVGGRIYSCPF